MNIYHNELGDIRIIRFENGHKYIVANNDETVRHMGIIEDELYEKKVYAKFDCTGIDVIDVGAYNGETAVYFLNKGARKVYAFEPFKSAEFIAANVLLNCDNFNVEVKRCAITGGSDIPYDKNYINNGASRLADSESECLDEILTLEDIIAQWGIRDALLKIDCEGFEHEIFASDLPTFRLAFKYVIVECHDQYTDVETALRLGGYDTSFDKCYDTCWLVYGKRVDDDEVKHE